MRLLCLGEAVSGTVSQEHCACCGKNMGRSPPLLSTQRQAGFRQTEPNG